MGRYNKLKKQKNENLAHKRYAHISGTTYNT